MNKKVQQCGLTRRPRRLLGRCISLLAMLLALGLESSAEAAEVEGFVEPYRSIDVAAAESGIIQSCLVREGDEVTEGQVLAKLDQNVHLALLAIGEKSKDFRGRLQSAQAELQLRQHRLAKLEQLRERGHARQEEVARARTDVAIAEGSVISAEEDLLLKELEYERIQAQIERRIIRAPLNGVVTTIRRQRGEFVPGADPHILTIVQLDSLLAKFSVKSVFATDLKVNQTVQVHFPLADKTATGRIEFICPVDDAESGTVRVKVRIENRPGLHRSGQRCRLLMPDREYSPTKEELMPEKRQIIKEDLRIILSG